MGLYPIVELAPFLMRRCQLKRLRLYTLLALACIALPLGAAAKPTRGGANHSESPNSIYPQAAFNVIVRVQPTYFGPGSNGAVGRPADANQRALLFVATITGEQAQPYVDAPEVELMDADGVMADVRRVTPANLNLQPKAAGTLYVYFWAPKDFVPDHVVYRCKSLPCKPLLIKFKR